MKHILSITLSILLLLALAACGADFAVQLTPSAPSMEPTPSPEPIESAPPAAETFSLTGPLAVYQADLTHDGVEESLSLTYEVDEYVLTVLDSSTGESLWSVAAAPIPHAQNLRIHLYERDGLQYLLEWDATVNQGLHFTFYRIYSLTPEGAQVILEEDFFEYDGGFTEDWLKRLDIDALQTFEDRLNALLADSELIVSATLDGVRVNFDGLSGEQRLTLQWDSGAEDYRRWQSDPSSTGTPDRAERPENPS